MPRVIFHHVERGTGFKPYIDNRFNDEDELTTHSGASFPAIRVNDSDEILGKINNDTRVVGIDEAQFLDKEETPKLVKILRKRGIRTIIAGLDMDFRGEPFGPIPELLAIAKLVAKLPAICSVCNEEDAYFTQRIKDGEPANYSDPIVEVGAEELYEARCAEHRELPGDPY